jgi:hypothetical protein
VQAEDQPEGSAGGIEPTRNRRSSSKAKLSGKSKTQVGDWSRSRARDATAGVGCVVRQAGPKGRSTARAEGRPDGSAEGISVRRESEVRFEGETRRLVEGASRRAAGRLGRKTGRGRKPGISWKAAGRTAGDASRMLIGRQSPKVDRRRKSMIDRKGLAERSAANASWRPARRQVKSLTPMRVEGCSWKARAGRWIAGAGRRSIRKARLNG